METAVATRKDGAMKLIGASGGLALAGLLGALACGGRQARNDVNERTFVPSGSECETLGLSVSATLSMPEGWDACTLALRAAWAMIGDTTALRALGPRSLVPSGAELQWLSEKEFGATGETRFLSVMLRLPGASHDVEVRFSDAGVVTSVSAVHKPLQR